MLDGMKGGESFIMVDPDIPSYPAFRRLRVQGLGSAYHLQLVVGHIVKQPSYSYNEYRRCAKVTSLQTFDKTLVQMRLAISINRDD